MLDNYNHRIFEIITNDDIHQGQLHRTFSKSTNLSKFHRLVTTLLSTQIREIQNIFLKTIVAAAMGIASS